MHTALRNVAVLAFAISGSSVATGQQELYRLSGPQFFSSRIEMDRGVLMMRESGSHVRLRDVATHQVLHDLQPPVGGYGGNWGYAIDIDEGLAVVSTPYHFTIDSPGVVDVYDVATGAHLRTIHHPNGYVDDYFGWSVSLSGGKVLIGAPGDNTPLGGTDAGAAFLFDANTGQLLREFAPAGLGAKQQFGYSVALDDDVALVSGLGGSNGSQLVVGRAVLFQASTGATLHEIPAPYGALAVALNAPYAAVSGDNNYGTIPGYFGGGVVRVYDTATGGFLHQFRPPFPSPHDSFGDSMEIEGTRLVTGTEDHSDFGNAWVFDLLSGTIAYELTPSTGGRGGDNFGGETALDGNMVVVGAITDTVNGGAAYAYSLDNLGASHCEQAPNSTGYPATVSVAGSASLGDQALTLRANNVPESQFGIFFAGTGLTNTPLGSGMRCAGGALIRISPPVFSQANEMLWEVNFSGLGAQIAATTYYVQTWYRDGAPLGGGTHLSDVAEVLLVP